MKPPKIPRASGVVRTGALALLIGLAGRARAESDTSLPPGFQWGSLFVAPSLATGLFVNSNPFNRSYDDLANSKNAGDIISILNPAVIATLPFRNSYFRTTYAGVFRNYQDPNTASNNAQDLQVDLNLRFASYDQLEFKADQEWGAADTFRYDGGESMALHPRDR